jgi:hypothetical protein
VKTIAHVALWARWTKKNTNIFIGINAFRNDMLTAQFFLIEVLNIDFGILTKENVYTF